MSSVTHATILQFLRNVLRVLCLRPRTKMEGREVIKIFPCFVKMSPDFGAAMTLKFLGKRAGRSL